ncbi:MAG: type IV toxin-antitoxin system AbiEi family antitoxin domain-containing protein [Solirubrobacteraceae bacterium]
MVGESVTDLAERQWGVVTRAQLTALGVSERAIEGRVRRGALRRLHRGVYALGHAALRDEGVWLAAVLACGPGAVLSHLAAARLWGMRTSRGDMPVHVSLVAGRSDPAGVIVHRTRRLSGADVTVERGIRVTTPARTVIDCADTLTYAELRVLADHGVRLDTAAIRRAQQRAPNRRGAANITRLLGDEIRTRSALERAFRRLCRDHDLPAPRFNQRVLGHERDAVWPAQRLIAELDGHAFHAPKPAREADYERDAALVAAGWRVVRFTHDQVFHEPDAVAARLAALLAV